jgi:cellulose synthase/poly-beta-1,6-N-acetylglucosamine synthase-like glycosyltransferase
MELVFAIGVLLCAYTYVGYPMLVAMLARLRAREPARDPGWTPTVTACVAVHNGAAHLEAKLRSLLAQHYPPDRFEVLVYADGCSDDSVAIARRVAREDPRVRVIEATQRAGKPTGLNRMREDARGDVLLMTDVRQPLEPECTRRLVEMLADPSVGCVSGNLVLPIATGAGFYWNYENWIRSAEARFRGMVGVTGPIYAVRRGDVEPLPADTILDDMWIPMKLRLRGRRLLFCADAVAYDAAFDDEREFGRKVRTLAGNYQLFARLPALLVPWRNPSWFETFSHKLCRLACPFALIAIAIATLALLYTTRSESGLTTLVIRAAALAELAFVLLVALGARAGALGRFARTFVVLNAAALVGLWRFLRGRQRITW